MVIFTKPILAVIKSAIAELYTHTTLTNLLEMYGFTPDKRVAITNKLTKASAYIDFADWNLAENNKKLIELLTQVFNENNHLIKLGEEGATSNAIFEMTRLNKTLDQNEIKWNGSRYTLPSSNVLPTNEFKSLKLSDLTNIESAFSKYKAIAVLGEGGCGKVFLVEDESNQKYALKLLNPEKANSEKLKRFKNEIFFSLKSNHKNIIKVLDIGFIKFGSQKCPFYIMPYYPQTFRKIMEQKKDPHTKLDLYISLIEAVQYAHSTGCWHRDIKPENVMFDETNNELILTDFGIAHIVEDFIKTDVETKVGSRLANFQYASPEQRQAGGSVDHRSDTTH